VHIGFGAVVGANSFVSSDVPPFAIVGGSPAKMIRYRLSDPQQRAVMDSKWWLNEPAEARRILSELEANLGLGSTHPNS
jgi:serine acetyltransferase